jgi:hypothetical protein
LRRPGHPRNPVRWLLNHQCKCNRYYNLYIYNIDAMIDA